MSVNHASSYVVHTGWRAILQDLGIRPADVPKWEAPAQRDAGGAARYYLKSSAMSGAEISFLLGFEDPNSFFRAFHAWTG